MGSQSNLSECWMLTTWRIVRDWLAIRLARRNNGVLEAEHQMWPLPLCTVTLPGPLLLIYYLVDSYAQLSNDAMSTIMLVRHNMSFAMGYRTATWITNLCHKNYCISAVFIGMACFGAFLVMTKWGNRMTHSWEKY
ncbi:MFS transporter [Fusarium sp. MPI-SDFR-AT-0072]|nr:MFS transporter [Fusarium sp. MPI-SDFR-AT-0072]